MPATPARSSSPQGRHQHHEPLHPKDKRQSSSRVPTKNSALAPSIIKQKLHTDGKVANQLTAKLKTMQYQTKDSPTEWVLGPVKTRDYKLDLVLTFQRKDARDERKDGSFLVIEVMQTYQSQRQLVMRRHFPNQGYDLSAHMFESAAAFKLMRTKDGCDHQAHFIHLWRDDGMSDAAVQACGAMFKLLMKHLAGMPRTVLEYVNLAPTGRRLTYAAGHQMTLRSAKKAQEREELLVTLRTLGTREELDKVHEDVRLVDVDTIERRGKTWNNVLTVDIRHTPEPYIYTRHLADPKFIRAVQELLYNVDSTMGDAQVVSDEDDERPQKKKKGKVY